MDVSVNYLYYVFYVYNFYYMHAFPSIPTITNTISVGGNHISCNKHIFHGPLLKLKEHLVVRLNATTHSRARNFIKTGDS